MHVRLQCNMPLFSLYMKSCCSDYSTHPCRTWLATEALVTVARDNINVRATGTGRRFPLPYLRTLFVLKRGCNNNPRFSGLPLHFIRWICEWSPTTSSPSITKTVICSFAVSLLGLLLLPLRCYCSIMARTTRNVLMLWHSSRKITNSFNLTRPATIATQRRDTIARLLLDWTTLCCLCKLLFKNDWYSLSATATKAPQITLLAVFLFGFSGILDATFLAPRRLHRSAA